MIFGSRKDEKQFFNTSTKQQQRKQKNGDIILNDIDVDILNGSDADLKDFVRDLEKHTKHHHRKDDPHTGHELEEEEAEVVSFDHHEGAGEGGTRRATLSEEETNQKNEERSKFVKSLMFFEEEYLLLNLTGTDHNNINFERCRQCFDAHSSKKFLILNFQQQKEDRSSASSSPRVNQQ